MWVKILGSVLLVLSSGGIGYISGQDLKYHIDDLNYLMKILSMINGEITYSRIPLKEVFYRIGNRLDTPYREWMLGLSSDLKSGEKSLFFAKWKHAIDRDLRHSNLTKGDLNDLKSFGNQMGYLDVKMQERMIEYYIGQLREEIAHLSRGLEGRLRIRQCLGIAVGILLVTVLY